MILVDVVLDEPRTINTPLNRCRRHTVAIFRHTRYRIQDTGHKTQDTGRIDGSSYHNHVTYPIIITSIRIREQRADL